MALMWQHPFTCIISGITGSGKSSFVAKLIGYADRVIKPTPRSIIWCYSVYQTLFDSLKGVEFHEGVIDVNSLEAGTLLILDDLMHEANEKVEKIFTKYSHHKDISVLFLTQNIFFKNTRTMSLNSHYIVLFKNPRDATQIAHLARQMYTGKSKFMIEAFRDAMSKPYTYLMIDLRPETEDMLRLRSSIFPDEDNFVYVPK